MFGISLGILGWFYLFIYLFYDLTIKFGFINEFVYILSENSPRNGFAINLIVLKYRLMYIFYEI